MPRRSWIMPTDIQGTNVDMYAQWDRMTSAVAAVEPVKEAAVLASVVAVAADGSKTAADVDAATNASHSRITMILLTPTGILPRTSENA